MSDFVELVHTTYGIVEDEGGSHAILIEPFASRIRLPAVIGLSKAEIKRLEKLTENGECAAD
ncbi:hypothetical protein BBD41_19755 [Paenibacillus ihbetae]|uniref:Uncharacterized protein n=1 Tax=Paenibacillus ihbetae TaxID=1870820 RepID=A0A1B2E3T5_9BACL|nr:hypothetical protein BBD41_19755 [Paenibacillus ihbetae]